MCVKSPGVLKKYINKEFTVEDLDQDGFWHLGDLAYYDDDEYLFYSARLKDVMKYNGQQVVDRETGKIPPPYAVGEMCVKSPGVPKKCINKEFTKEYMDQDGFWHLGDLAYYDDDEYLFYSARLKDVMKNNGQQIAPAELESILLKHPDVLECCVVGKTCMDQGGELPAAFIIKKPGSDVKAEELYDFVSGKVIDEKKLRGGIFFVESLPKNAVGKVLRYELKKLLT